MREIDSIIIHHSAAFMGTHTWGDIKEWHLRRGFSDIGYHFGVCLEDGLFRVKEGRPLDKPGAHCRGHNKTTIGVCFDGNFEEERLPNGALVVGSQLVNALLVTFNLGPDNIIGHRELASTLCPGSNFPLALLRRMARGRQVATSGSLAA